jgi:hypothetical protein
METKQTAVQWYRLESQKLIIKAICKEISNKEWRLLENKLGEQALQMEREQIEDSFKEGQYNGTMYEERGFDTITSNKFYEQKYGGKLK